jgi:hypothetical protein
MKATKQLVLSMLAMLALFGLAHRALASSIIPLSPAQHINASAAVFRGTVLSLVCFQDNDGLIYTRASIRVDEPLLGKFPDVLQVIHRGGRVGSDDEYAGLSPRFVVGGEYLLFVSRRPDGRLHCTQGFASAIPLANVSAGNASGTGSASTGGQLLAEVRSILKQSQSPGSDVTDQAGSSGTTSSATTGMLGGVNTRYLQPDRGEPIPYLIDAESLPAGITLTQATNAVQQALNAWTAVTSLKFKLDGIVSFGQAASTITTKDEKLRIQLHDNYNVITTPSVLGIGGRGASTSPLAGVGWDLGGNVAGNEFFKTTYGYVVLESGNTSMQTLATFTEVLCHEIGHALNMAHSSENSGEPDTTLKQAIMFFQAHADGRGAALGTYDPPIIQQVYPANNTPPYAYGRVLDVTSDSPSQPNVPGINDVELRGYDLQTTNLVLLTTNATAINGSFTRTGNIIKYAASGFFSDSGRLDPAGAGYYDIIYARHSDGTNASAYVSVRVLSFNSDTFPNPTGDGIPDNWMTAYFGSANPAAGSNRGAQQDNDGDGMKNIDEYRAGMNPTLAASGQRIMVINRTNIQFQAKPYELYELHASANMTNWARAANPIVPTNSAGTFTGFTNNAPYLFFRVQKVP